jgi:phosphinothricin acetyltransferase
MRITSIDPGDWESIREIYLEGIATRQATFETEAPTWEAWDESHLPGPRLKATEGETIVGWTALTPVSRRAVYSGVAELSIFVAAAWRGRGVGKALLSALVSASEEVGIWTLQAGIIAGNAASIALHRSCGFREVGIRERLGRLDGMWHDVVLMERRSSRVHGTTDSGC